MAITAAMPNGTGLDLFRPHHPKRYFDVGIAEEHAVVFAAGMATRGFRPVCAIYSTFLQRGFRSDRPRRLPAEAAGPLLHGPRRPLGRRRSHASRPVRHRLSCAAFRSMVLMAPKDEDELADMMKTGLRASRPQRHPLSARRGGRRGPQGRAAGASRRQGRDPSGRLRRGHSGPGHHDAAGDGAGQRLEREGYSAAVINPRFIKPLDREMLETVRPPRGRLRHL